MNAFTRIALPFLGLSVAAQTSAQERDRSRIADEYKWNLADLYASPEVWKSEKERIVAEIPSVAQYKGSLGKSAGQLLGCLDKSSNLSMRLNKLSSYAGMLSDQDTRDSKNLAMVQEVSQIYTDFAAKTSYIEPEILKIDRHTVESFLNVEPRLGVYRHYLDDILRRQAHTGTEGEEKIIADAGLMADGAQNIYGIFSNADFPYPQVTLSDGKSVKLDASAYSLYRAGPNREDRTKVFAAFFGALNAYRRTFGTELNAEVKKNMFYMRARKYESCLQSALDANNIPTSVYKSLVENVNANLTTFHRYLRLRKRILGVAELHYYDLYAPLLSGIELKYSVEEAEKNVVAALTPLGKEYCATVERACRERWIDFFPNEGKRSGAYSNGSAYDVHPYMLLNYNGEYNDVSTLAHELGHTMQSYYSNKTQPYPTAGYPIFVAEVASTFNEALLIDYILRNTSDDAIRLSLLGQYLEGIKGTVFRQTQFAEFELRIHEMAERGEALTGDVLDSVYTEITRRYYGHDQGVCIVDDEVKAEWAYIPHFYYNFYVYQYATSFTASTALSEQVLAGDTTATKRYLEFLSAGGSDYPIELLRKAGIDMTTSLPFSLTMKKMNRVMEEIETILGRMKK